MEKVDLVGHGCGHGQFQNTHLHLHNIVFTAVLASKPVIDPLQCFYPFISAWAK